MKTQQLELSEIDNNWIQSIVERFPLHISVGMEFSCDDLHDWDVMPPPHDNHWGAAMNAIKNTYNLAKAGYRASRRPGANGRVISQWIRV